MQAHRLPYNPSSADPTEIQQQRLQAMASNTKKTAGSSSSKKRDKPKALTAAKPSTKQKTQHPKPQVTLASLNQIRCDIFPFRLHQMLDDAPSHGFEEVVSWLPNNPKAFRVWQKEVFALDILPRYFKQSRYKSFQRQLNLWGFERSTYGAEKHSVSHKLLKRGNRDLCRQMKRVKVKGTGSNLGNTNSCARDSHRKLAAIKQKADASAATKNGGTAALPATSRAGAPPPKPASFYDSTNSRAMYEQLSRAHVSSSQSRRQAKEAVAAVALSSLASTGSTHGSEASVTSAASASEQQEPTRSKNATATTSLVTPPSRCTVNAGGLPAAAATVASSFPSASLQQQHLQELLTLVQLQNARSSLAAAAEAAVDPATSLGMALPSLSSAVHPSRFDTRPAVARRHTIDHLQPAPAAAAPGAGTRSSAIDSLQEAHRARAALLYSASAAASSQALLSEAMMAAATSAAVAEHRHRRLSLEHLKATEDALVREVNQQRILMSRGGGAGGAGVSHLGATRFDKHMGLL